MELGDHDLLVLLGLLAAAAVLVSVAPRLRVPYPILLVVGGLALGFVPGVPHVVLPPDLVLVAVLPPLLYSAAFYTSLHDLRRNARPIGLLAIGLVLTTTCVVAAVAHSVAGLGWGPAFVLGAVVSPTDPLAATEMGRRLGVPRRVLTVIEGESLVNDGTALVVFRFATIAVATGAFSLLDAGASFAWNVLGGIGVGLAVGWVVRQARRRLDNPPVEVTIAFLSGYFAFLPADVIGVSGVIAVVTTGVYVGWFTPELTTAEVRISGASFWAIITFLLNALLFVLVGLQLPSIVDALGGTSWGVLLRDAAAVVAAVVLARIAWVFPGTYVPRLLSRRVRDADPMPAWQHTALVAWTGLRGAVSLAAALAIPEATDAGAPFPDRELIVFLAFSVILVTLVAQGLSLPLVIRALGVEPDGDEEHEEVVARVAASEAALARLDELADEEWVRDDTAERLRGSYGFRRRRFTARFDDGDDGRIEERSLAFQRLRRELLEAERQAVYELRRTGRITDEVMHRVVRDLDLEELRLDA